MFSILLKNDPYKTVFQVLSVESDGVENGYNHRTYTQFLIYRNGDFVWVDSDKCYLWEVRDA